MRAPRRRRQLTVDPCLALADEWQREVRQRCEIAARPHRAAARNDRQHARAEQGEQELGDLDRTPECPWPACSRASRSRLARSRPGRAPPLRRHGCAATGAGAPPRAPSGSRVHEAAEAGVDAVRLLGRFGSSLHDRPRGSHLLARRIVELRGRAADSDLPHVCRGKVRPRSVEPRSCGPSVESSPDRSRARAGEAREHATRRTRRCATPTRPPRRRRRRA